MITRRISWHVRLTSLITAFREAGGTGCLIHPHPVGTVVGVKVFTAISVVAAGHFEVDDMVASLSLILRIEMR